MKGCRGKFAGFALSALGVLCEFTFVSAATDIFYSVGTSTADLKNASNVTVSGTTATFSAGQPNNVGVGDQIAYNSTDTCYITGRTSSTAYSVMSKNGGTPTARTTVTVNSIKRAFTTLQDAWYNADDAAHLGTSDLTSGGGYVLHIACYGDGEETITSCDIGNYWTTGSSNYIRIFAPYSTTQVGTTQRHNGKWSTSAYRMRDSNGSYGIAVRESYVYLEGLQYQCDMAASTSNNGLYFESTTNCKVEQCIVRADTTNAATVTDAIGIYGYAETGFAIYNNIVYDFRGTGAGGGIDGYNRMTIYGNTIYRCKYGISKIGGGYSQNCKNNIVQKCGTAFGCDFNEEANNISDQASGLNATNSKNSTTVVFVDSTGTPRDLHLKSTDTQAIGAGATLSSYYTLDIDGTTRAAPWCIGADEVDTVPETDANIYYSVGTNTAALYSGNASTSSKGVTVLASAADNNIGVGDEVRVGSNRYYIRRRDSSTDFRIQNSAANGGVPGDTNLTFSSQAITIYRAFNSLSAAEAGASGANYLNTSDLTTNSHKLHFVCYGDGTDNTAVTVDGWTTSSTCYINIFTPTSYNQVGASQRHSGAWSGSRYCLSVGQAVALLIKEENVRVDGLQVRNTTVTATDAKGIEVAPYTGTTIAINISNCIIRGVASSGYDWHSGIEFYSVGATVNGTCKVWNNIIYDFGKGRTNDFGIQMNNPTAAFNFYAYNNTVFNCGAGIRTDNVAGFVLKNNLCFDNTDNYLANTGSFTGTNNLSGSGTDAAMPSTNKRDGVAVSFIDSANDNFHLSAVAGGAKDSGTDLSADTYIAFSTDIDGDARQGTWDIGADESPPTTNIYYSVGTRTAALYSGNAAAGSGMLTLSATGSDTIGVGDEVRVGSSRYYITQRYSNTYYDIQNSAANGGTPGATNISFSEQSVTIYRAFNCLDSAVHVNRTGTQNRASDANHLNTVNLVSGNFILNIVCYGDGSDANKVVVDGWTTGASNFIKIYTPTTATEVGITQRHAGKWVTSGAYILGPVDNCYLLQIMDEYVRVEGLLMDGNVATWSDVVAIKGCARGGDARIISNVIRSSGTIGASGIYVDSNKTALIANNVIYDFQDNSNSNGICGGAYGGAAGNVYAYSNTIYNCSDGIENNSANAIVAKNNLCYGTVNAFRAVAAFNAASNYNCAVTPLSGAPGANSRQNQTVTFVNTGSKDFHISGSDAGARNYGTDLSTDATYSFTVDIDGNARSGTWDIGADETYTAPAVIYYSVGTTTSFLYSGTGSANSGTLVITTGSAASSIGLGDEVRRGSIKYYIRSRSSSTAFGIQTATGSTSINMGDTIISIYRAFNSLNGAASGASGANYLNTTNLVTGGFQLHLACYADGLDNTAVVVSGYTTGPDNYLRIFTPTAGTEVGVSQRHAGVWDNAKYRLERASGNVLDFRCNYVRMEGLQVKITSTGADAYGITHGAAISGNADIRISHNIIVGANESGAINVRGINLNGFDAGATIRIYNNVVCDWGTGSGAEPILAYDGNASIQIYSNTCANGFYGIVTNTTANDKVIAKNNMVINYNTPWNGGDFNTAASGYNASSGGAPGAYNVTLSSSTKTDYFISNTDFHINTSASKASEIREKGTDLSSDQYFSFSDDIDGKTRFNTWDIGADQYWDEPGLAVTMDLFHARGGDANDTIFWRTESEKDNYGFNIYRRIKPVFWMTKVGAKARQLSVPDFQFSEKGRMAKKPVVIDNGQSPADSSSGPSTDNQQLATENLFEDRFGTDTSWTLVNLAGVIAGAKGGRSVGPRNYTFIDLRVENDITYEYTIEDIDYSNVKIRHGIAEATPRKHVPMVFALHQNFPNPFNPITQIRFDLPTTCRVDISVYDLRGRKIVTLVRPDKALDAGFHKTTWSGRDYLNRPVASGLYFYRMQAAEFGQLRKMIMVK